jgi:hypothetical protein
MRWPLQIVYYRTHMSSHQKSGYQRHVLLHRLLATQPAIGVRGHAGNLPMQLGLPAAPRPPEILVTARKGVALTLVSSISVPLPRAQPVVTVQDLATGPKRALDGTRTRLL